MMYQLTTPEKSEFDASFPGQEMFLYWKCSKALWKKKIDEYSSLRPLLIPIFWGHHHLHGQVYDFGQAHKENDLGYLIELTQQRPSPTIFLLPLDPCPLMPQGGVPYEFSRDLQVQTSGLIGHILDAEDRQHTMVSFFSSHTYKAYRSFCKSFERFLSSQNKSCYILGLKSYYFDSLEGRPVSYFNDYSAVFQSGLAQFVKTSESSNLEQKNMRDEFIHQMRQLYESELLENLHKWLSGELRMCFLLGSSEDTLSRALSEKVWDQDLVSQSIQIKDFHQMPSLSLLSPLERSTMLEDFCREAESYQQSLKLLGPGFSHQTQDKNSLDFALICSAQEIDTCETRLSFSQAFYRELKSCDYAVQWCRLDEDLSEIDISFFVLCSPLQSQVEMSKVLKSFLNGNSWIISRQSLSSESFKKLEMFAIENDLEFQQYQRNGLQVLLYRLEETSLYLVDKQNESDTYEKLSLSHFISSLNVRVIDVKGATSTQLTWTNRSLQSYDFSFEQVRRYFFYNPSSYKEQIKVTLPSDFIFIKSLNPNGAEVKHKGHQVFLSMGAKSSLMIDIGVIDEH